MELQPKKKKDEQIGVRISAEKKAQFEKLCSAVPISMSDAVNQFIDQFIATHEIRSVHVPGRGLPDRTKPKKGATK